MSNIEVMNSINLQYSNNLRALCIHMLLLGPQAEHYIIRGLPFNPEPRTIESLNLIEAEP